MLTNPILPPKKGYVEVVSTSGEHEYRKVETPELDALATDTNLLKAQLQAQTDRSDFLEDCMAELAIQAYQ